VSFLPRSVSSLLAQIGPSAGHAARAMLVHFRESARFISRHTGIPAIFVAALLIVISWRMAKRMAHVAVEVAVVTLLLVALTKLGVVSW
jgi:heme A synthase